MEEHGSNNGIDSVLFGRYLAGEASPEEVTQLEDWIFLSPANKLLFDQYIATWNGLQPHNGYQLPDKAAAWRQMNDTINNSKKSTGVFRRLFIRYPVAAVIAGIVILSIIPLILLTKKGDRDPVMHISFTSVAGIKNNILPDGSSIVLNSNSTISFPPEFKADQRETELQGEAFFTIVPDPQRPFIIRFENINIQVLGTAFNVNSNPQAGFVETQVRSGKVKMFNARGEVTIAAGQTGIYNKESNSFLLKSNVNINSFSYATRNFVFSDEELASIIKYLEKAYSKNIVLENNQLGKCKMTSSFDNKSIEYIMDVIAATLDITYTIKGDTIYITGGEHEGC